MSAVWQITPQIRPVTAPFLIDVCCSAGKSAAGYDIHEKAQETGAAYGEHLHERDQKCDQCCRKGIENKSAGHYDDILGIIAQEKYDRNPKDGRRKEGEGTEHADCCEFLCFVIHVFLHSGVGCTPEKINTQKQTMLPGVRFQVC